MQAIADIIVKSTSDSQIKDLQLSQNTNSQNTSSSVSFAEFLKSSKASASDQEVKEVPASEKNDSIESYKENKETVKNNPENSSSEKITEKKSSDNDKKVESKSEEKLEKSDDSKIIVQKTEVKQPGNNKKLNETKEKSKDVKNEKVSDKKNEKLEKDLNRFNDFFNTQDVEPVKIAEVAEVSITDELEPQKNISDNNEMQLESVSMLETDSFADDKFISKNEIGKISKFDKDGKIIVKDLRTENTEKTVEKNDVKSTAKVEVVSEDNVNITMELGNQNSENNILSLNDQTAASNGSNFQAMLSNQIQQSAPEFVKAGNLILKDNDKGTINLVLHPDDLGNVKIHLSLDGKTISAQITVNTKEALEVFKENAQTLREAFAQNGFDAGNFDVSYGNQNNQSNQNFENNFNGTEFIAKRAYSGFEDSDGEYFQNNLENEKYSEYSVNIVA